LSKQDSEEMLPYVFLVIVSAEFKVHIWSCFGSVFFNILEQILVSWVVVYLVKQHVHSNIALLN